MRAPGRLATPEEFDEILVRTTDDGRAVRIKDVGRVELGAENYKSFGRLDGKPAGVLAVYLLPGANQLAVRRGHLRARSRSSKQLFPTTWTTRSSTTRRPRSTESIEEISTRSSRR